MRYSLLSRFQGTLLTAALGDELGAYGQLRHRLRDRADNAGSRSISAREQAVRLAPIAFTCWQPGADPEHDRTPSNQLASNQPASSQRSLPGGTIAIECTNALIQAGSWKEELMKPLGVPTGLKSSHDRQRASTPGAELAIAALPIALFFHDDTVKLRQALVQTVNLWQFPSSVEAGLLAVGYAIAQLLNERCDRLTLIPQTVAYLKQGTAKPTDPLLELIGTLEQVQTLVQQEAGLQAAIARLGTQASDQGQRTIALAFYCFLSTPNELPLSVIRAARLGDALPAVCALTGALSGAYNSTVGLPLAWRTDPSQSLQWGVSIAEMGQLATRLFAIWSGAYNPEVMATMPAIAAPGLIRPR